MIINALFYLIMLAAFFAAWAFFWAWAGKIGEKRQPIYLKMEVKNLIKLVKTVDEIGNKK